MSDQPTDDWEAWLDDTVLSSESPQVWNPDDVEIKFNEQWWDEL
jgi:hypothetical protein